VFRLRSTFFPPPFVCVTFLFVHLFPVSRSLFFYFFLAPLLFPFPLFEMCFGLFRRATHPSLLSIFQARGSDLLTFPSRRDIPCVVFFLCGFIFPRPRCHLQVPDKMPRQVSPFSPCAEWFFFFVMSTPVLSLSVAVSALCHIPLCGPPCSLFD